MRTEPADPMRYLSILYDAATLFTLYAPFLEAGSAPFRRLRRLISWGLEHAWPRVRARSREEIYGERFPQTAAPLEIVEITGGQTEFESMLDFRRRNLLPPGAITGYELVCYLEDTWVCRRGWKGSFVILRLPEHLARRTSSALAYVDCVSGEWGPLVDPLNPRWQPPPYGFPPLFFVPLSSGTVLWMRLESADELRVCYRGGQDRLLRNHHMVFTRAAGAAPAAGEEGKRGQPTVVSFLGVCMYHSFADGSCYMPLVQDLFAFYDEALQGPAANRRSTVPPLNSAAFEELERRLFDTFHLRVSPVRTSLRGSLFRFSGQGYGHEVGLYPGAIRALARAAAHYRLPLDVALLGLVVCAMARADAAELVEFTLYAPMRDGGAESMMVGLFSDWRDLSVGVDLELATVLGTMLQVGHKIRHRQWTVFNALQKPERIVVNMHPMDFERQAGFQNMGENMWHGGDQLRRTRKRESGLEWSRQPASIVIEQQDALTWWILMGVEYTRRPTPWMRKFIASIRETVDAFLLEPLTPVHRPLPSDAELLRMRQRQPIC